MVNFYLVRKKCCIDGSTFSIVAAPTVGTLPSGQQKNIWVQPILDLRLKNFMYITNLKTVT